MPQALRGYGSEAAGYLQRHSLRSFCTEVPIRERGWQPEQPCLSSGCDAFTILRFPELDIDAQHCCK